MNIARGRDFVSRKPMVRLAAALMFGTAMGAIAAVPAHAQQSQASLRGTITVDGAPATGTVTAIEVNTGLRRSATLAANGGYIFASLRPGSYRLEVANGETTRSTDTFTLAVAQNAQLNFDLGATPAPAADGGVTAPDTVIGDEIVVSAGQIQDLEGGEVGATISQRLIETLPQNNRNFLAFADLAPGVQFVTGSNGNSRLQGGAQASRSINVFIDGVSQKDYVLKNGITGQDSSQGNPFPQLAIGEYRVISSNYKAEFDQVSSVAITAITRSGTNDFHGEGFSTSPIRTCATIAPARFRLESSGKVDTQDMQFGGALGGPIIRDVAHFFVSYEGKRQQIPVDIFPGDNTAVGSLPSQYQGIFGSVNRNFNEDLYFGKIDVSPTASDLFEFTVKYRDESGISLNSGSNAYSTATDLRNEELRGLARWEHSGATFVNDFKVSYEDSSYGPTPLNFDVAQQFRAYVPTGSGTGIRSFDLFRIGGGSSYQDKGQTGWTVQNDFSYTGFLGHAIKFGVKAKWVSLNSLQQNQINPLYFYNATLNGPGSFNDSQPYRVQFGAPTGNGNPVVESNNFQLGLYLQDDWEVTDRLTLNIGLRWDYERTPAYLDYVTPADAVAAVSPANYPNLAGANYDINDYISTGSERKAFTGAFQPRVGFSYELDDNGTYVLFGGYGRSYDRNQFDFLQLETSTGSYSTRTFNFLTTPADPNNTCTPSSTCLAWDPVYLTEAGRQQLLAGTGPGGGRELNFINNDLKVPYSDQFSAGLRTHYDLLTLEVGYTHINSEDGFLFLLGNRRPGGTFFQANPAPGEIPNTPFGFAPPGFGSIILGTNGLETRSDAGYFKLTKRYSVDSPWSLDATYTYTEAEENRQFGEHYSLDFESIDDYPVLRSSGVPRHRLVMAGSVDTPIGVTLSSKLTLESPTFNKYFINSADPFSRTIAGTFAEGNGDRWGKRQVDFAATKYFDIGFPTGETQIWARVDVINLFNDRNYTSFSAETGQRNLNNFDTGGNPPRTIKFSAGFSF